MYTHPTYGSFPEKEPPKDPNQPFILVDGLYYTEEAVRAMIKILRDASYNQTVSGLWNFSRARATEVKGRHYFTTNHKSIIAEDATVYAFPDSISTPNWEKTKATVRVCLEIDGKLERIQNYVTCLTLEEAKQEWDLIQNCRYNGPDESQGGF